MDMRQLRSLWLAFTLLVGVVVGAAGGLLVYVGGGGLSIAVIAAGATFASTVTVALMILGFVGMAAGTAVEGQENGRRPAK